MQRRQIPQDGRKRHKPGTWRWCALRGRDTPHTQVVSGRLLSPDTWHHDFGLVSRPGNDLVQLRLFADYARNPPLYPRLHAYLRDSRVPLLAVWGP